MQFHIREPNFDHYRLKILLQNAIDATILNARFDCEFMLDVNPPDYKAHTDEKLFVELISYLIQNSLESIDHENGRIQIRAKLVSKLRTEKAGETYNIRIIDNGCGISEKNMNKIYKLHFTTKAEKGGTGLGVPRAVQICEVLNGELFYNSTEGQGTEAILNFRRMDED
jgi:signal transduction histidine kinase